MRSLQTIRRQIEPDDLDEQVRALKQLERQPAFIAGQQSVHKIKPPPDDRSLFGKFRKIAVKIRVFLLRR